MDESSTMSAISFRIKRDLVSYKVFLVKTRCRGARTPTRAEAEACGASGIELLADEWLVEDFRRGVAHGWSQVKQYIRARLDPGKINIRARRVPGKTIY